jgi:hypothetical protein
LALVRLGGRVLLPRNLHRTPAAWLRAGPAASPLLFDLPVRCRHRPVADRTRRRSWRLIWAGR